MGEIIKATATDFGIRISGEAISAQSAQYKTAQDKADAGIVQGLEERA